MPTLTNRTSAPALRGQDAIVTFSWTDAIANMANLFVGQRAGVVSSGKIGFISEIDTRGLTVRVKPSQPSNRFDSTTTPGILNVNELITFF